jgi:hypothetical protein
MFKKASLFLLVMIFFMASIHAAYAQTAEANAQTQVQTGAASQASNAGNTQQANFYTPDKQSIDYNAHGTQRLEAQAPIALGGAAAGFSNENCANTTQFGASTFWLGFAKGNAKESIRCNARRDAGVYVALGGTMDSVGSRTKGDALRAMAIWKMCTATEADVEACKRLHLLGDDDMKNAPDQDNQGQAIPHRESNWTGRASTEQVRR